MFYHLLISTTEAFQNTPDQATETTSNSDPLVTITLAALVAISFGLLIFLHIVKENNRELGKKLNDQENNFLVDLDRHEACLRLAREKTTLLMVLACDCDPVDRKARAHLISSGVYATFIYPLSHVTAMVGNVRGSVSKKDYCALLKERFSGFVQRHEENFPNSGKPATEEPSSA